MDDLFLTVLNMSLTGAVVILFVLLARLALRRAPRIFSYALWAIVLFRLLCPFAVESAFSLLPSAGVVTVGGRGEGSAQVIRIETGIGPVDRQVNDFLMGHPYQGQAARPGDAGVVPTPPLNQRGPAPDWRTIPAAIWLAGAAALLGYSALSLLRLRRRLVGWAPLEGEENVRLADHIPSPFVLGVLRPKIYLPSGLPEGERDYVLLHERTHIRRGDHIFRALAWLALAVHWFDPLVWLAFHLAGRDMEMSCDEAVLRKMGRDIRADYSSSLLRLSQGGGLRVGPLAFGDGDPKGRIQNVLRWKKPALWVTAAALAAVACIGVALGTDRGGAADPPGPPEPDTELTFSLDTTGEEPCVRMEGSVGDVVLLRGAFWSPPHLFEEYPLGWLSMVYPDLTDGIEGHVIAGWADESRASVLLSTRMTAMLSSQLNVGWWEFTVDLGSGTVTAMNGCSSREGLPDAETRFYPEAIPDREAVEIARVAAKLLTAAEDWYHDQQGLDSGGGNVPGPTPPERVWAWGGGWDAQDDLEEWARDNGISYRFSQRDVDDAIAVVRAVLEEEWAREEWVISFEVTDVYEARLETLRQWRMYFDRTSELFADWTQEDMETRYIVIGADFTCEYDHTRTFMDDGRRRVTIALTRTPGGEWRMDPGATSWDLAYMPDRPAG